MRDTRRGKTATPNADESCVVLDVFITKLSNPFYSRDGHAKRTEAHMGEGTAVASGLRVPWGGKRSGRRPRGREREREDGLR